MAKDNYSWPSRGESDVIGKVHDRLDGLDKATGKAEYTYDINPKNLLFAKALGCPHAHCKVEAIEVSAAQEVSGVVHVHVLRDPGYEVQWEGDLLAVVAAESEGAAAEGVSKIQAVYEHLDVLTDDEGLDAAQKAGRTVKAGERAETENEPGDDDDEDEFVDKEIERLFKQAKHVVEGYYGIDVITHCCLEPHGATVYWEGDQLKAYLSTQNVSGTANQFAEPLGITSDSVEVICDYIGGGFGSKFAADYWGVAAAEISKKTGRPVKLMLSRDQELKNAGSRPSGYIKARLGADENGVVQVWESEHWGTGGFRGGTVRAGQIPYVMVPKNVKVRATGVKTNTAGARAWRAPNHPQACAMSQTAFDDLAAKMGRDSLDVFMANAPSATNGKGDVYLAQMKIAAELMDWKSQWHVHGKGPAQGSVVEGLGMALHTWGGSAGNSNTQVKIHPDGGVEAFCGTQDLGTGTRIVIAMVLAETLGLPVEAIKVHIGTSKYPSSGASGGSTTVGGVAASHRKAGEDARDHLFDLVADRLNVDASGLEAAGGRIRVKGNPGKGLDWKQACRLLGMNPLETSGSHKRGDRNPLWDEGVAGVQMAHVAVDKETGVVKMKKFVAVQDQGLVINPKTCKSQIYGAAIMGIAYALFEQRLTDPATGAFVNAELANYRLPRLGDVGEIVVHLYEPESERSRGVIGNGEPPVISPGAAISNAVANALGVRVPVLPITPKRVLDALASVGRA